MIEMDWIQFIYFLLHLSVKMFLLFTIANALVCGNVLLLDLTLKRIARKKKPVVASPVASSIEAKAAFLNMETGKQEKWVQKNIWVKED